jgi:methyl-accepting chemotaxis protein
MATPGQPYMRRRYFVNRAIQLPYFWLLVSSLIALSLMLCGCVFLVMWMTLIYFDMERDPLAAALYKGVAGVMAVQAVVFIPLVVWLALRSSHRVAGPLVRIRKGLRQLTDGDFNVRVTLRKGDALTEIADDINRLAESLRSRLR